MEFVISQKALQKELAFIQGVVEKKNTIPVLSNLLIESIGENTLRLIATDLDVTLRCEADAESINQPGSICVQARKLLDIARLLPDALVRFKKEENDWVSVKCEKFNSKVPGVPTDSYPEIPTFKSAPISLSASIFKTLIDRTIFAITQEESRYTLSGAKFILDENGARMVTTDGHRLAFVSRQEIGKRLPDESLDVLIPKKTLVELGKLSAELEGDLKLGSDDNHIYFEVGTRLLISRKLTGQFPNYEMVMPKSNDKSVVFEASRLNEVIRRVALMADDRSHAVKFSILPGTIEVSSHNAEEGEAVDSIETDYDGEPVTIGFNAQYIQDFLNVIGDKKVKLEFKDSNGQAQLQPADAEDYEYKYVVMPMRI
jgi:DNA polymerase-3 subunit beta